MVVGTTLVDNRRVGEFFCYKLYAGSQGLHHETLGIFLTQFSV